MTLAKINDELVTARTNKKRFWDKLESIIPWEIFIEIIKPSYYKGELGNKPYPLELMLRIFILQNVYDLADMAVMNEVIDSRAFSNFCGINSPDEVPNGDTIGRFRNILTRNGLQEKIFAEVVNILINKGLILKKGTIVNSTLKKEKLYQIPTYKMKREEVKTVIFRYVFGYYNTQRINSFNAGGLPPVALRTSNQLSHHAA